MKKSDQVQEHSTGKDPKDTAEPAAKKTGLIRAERSDRPLLKGHVTHLINHG